METATNSIAKGLAERTAHYSEKCSHQPLTAEFLPLVCIKSGMLSLALDSERLERGLGQAIITRESGGGFVGGGGRKKKRTAGFPNE